MIGSASCIKLAVPANSGLRLTNAAWAGRCFGRRPLRYVRLAARNLGDPVPLQPEPGHQSALREDERVDVAARV